MSTQVYLSTWPRKNWLRLVPFSRMISARAISRGSLIRSAPPSPATMFFVSWKLNAASCPKPPQRLPLYVEMIACAASSITSKLMSRGDLEDRIHRTRDAGVMHRDDRTGPWRDRGLDLALIQVQRVRADVDEHRPGAAQHERVGGRHEGERRHDDFVARPDSASIAAISRAAVHE